MSTPSPDPADDDIRVGVSACLLGEKVRFDGGDERDPFLVGTRNRDPHPKELALRNHA